MRIRPTAGTLIARLGMRPHPEGGHYVETWRSESSAGTRPAGSAILFLLQAGEVSAWHRIDAAELWHFHAGDPLELSIADGAGAASPHRHILGGEVMDGQQPQVVVPPGDWQSARTLGAWTLVGCTVAPAFTFETFELAAPGWEPGGAGEPPAVRSGQGRSAGRRGRGGATRGA